MTKRSLVKTLSLLMALSLGALAPSLAEAKSRPAASAKDKKGKGKAKASKAKKRSARLVCTGKGKKKKCRRNRGAFAGRKVMPEDLRAEPLPRPSGDLHIFSANLREEVKVNIYRPDGSYDEAALAKLDEIFRCRRTNEVRAIDPRLYEILSIVYDNYGKRRIQLTSGFRYQRNEGSRHYHGAAADVRIDGVPWRELYKFVESLDRGGMGIGNYPHDGFVHIDFRAPGEGSFRWSDTTGPGRKADGRRPSIMWKRSSKPNT